MSKTGRNINNYLTRLKNGEKCFDDLFDFSYGYMEVVAFKYLSDKSKTDEAVGNTFKYVYYNFDKFDTDNNGLAWMYDIAKNEACKINIGDCAEYIFSESAEEAIFPNRFPDVVSEKYELCTAISKLTEDEQNLLDLAVFRDMGIKAAAQASGMNYKAARKAINQIYKKLKDFMK